MRVHGIAGLPAAGRRSYAHYLRTLFVLCAPVINFTLYMFLYCTQHNSVRKNGALTQTLHLLFELQKSAIRKLKCARDTIRTVHVQLLYKDKFRPKNRRFNIYTLLTVCDRNKYITLIYTTAPVQKQARKHKHYTYYTSYKKVRYAN